jgi:hypothetical protein
LPRATATIGAAMNDASPGKRHYETLVVQPWGEPGKLLQATIVRVCPTVVDAFRYMDYVELTLARHGLPLDTLSDLVVVDAERRPIARPAVTLAMNLRSAR